MKLVNPYSAFHFFGEFQNGGIFTDNSWKCTSSEEANWFSEEFNDSLWPYAKIFGDHGEPTISQTAKKIWCADGAATCYCRKILNTGKTKTQNL